jgi:hypothetical protein
VVAREEVLQRVVERVAEVERARQFRTAQVATGATALALMVAGATHALATFREESEIRKQRVGPSISPGPGPTLNLSLPW